MTVRRNSIMWLMLQKEGTADEPLSMARTPASIDYHQIIVRARKSISMRLRKVKVTAVMAGVYS